MPTDLPTPLPSSNDVPIGQQRNAFKVVKGLEARSLGRPQIIARLLGWLLIHLPEDAGRETLAADILWCLVDSEDSDSDTALFPAPEFASDFDFFVAAERDDRLCELGGHLLDNFIEVFNRKRRTPAPSTPPSRDSSDTELPLEEPKRTYAMSNAEALVRDGSACALSRRFDVPADEAIIQDIQQRFPGYGPPTIFVRTQACHIIPQGFLSGKSDFDVAESNPKRNWVVNPAAVLSRYTPVKIFKTLQGADIHRLENVITLGTDTHGLFGRLDFCLDSTPEPNVYRIFVPTGINFSGVKHNELVTLVDRSPVQLQGRYPLPSSEYLKVHAMCCRVAHLSGGASYINGLHERWEDAQVLAEDGSSTDLLAFALARIALR